MKGRTSKAEAGDKFSPCRYRATSAVGLQRLTTAGEFNLTYLHLAKQEVL